MSAKIFVAVSFRSSKMTRLNFGWHLVFSIWYLVTGQSNEKNKSLQFCSTDFNEFNAVGFLQLCSFDKQWLFYVVLSAVPLFNQSTSFNFPLYITISHISNSRSKDTILSHKPYCSVAFWCISINIFVFFQNKIVESK